MKNGIVILLLLLGIGNNALYCQDGSSAANKRDKEQIEGLLRWLEETDIEFVGQWAIPLGYSNVDLTTNTNYLRMTSDSVFAELPFFGRAYYSTPGEKGGISFSNAYMEKMTTVHKKKDRVIIYFEVQGDDDFYKCTLEIFIGKNASLSVNCNNLQAISYDGEVHEWKKVKK